MAVVRSATEQRCRGGWPAGDDREEALDQVEPGAAGRGEVQVTLGCLVSQVYTAGCLWVA
jgi:hypothetical protein